MVPTITTDRLILRGIESSDSQGIFDLDSDPEVHKYLGQRPITTMTEAEETVRYIQGQYKNHGFGRWAIIDKATNEFVGWGGLKYETGVRSDGPYNDVGYRLKRKFWGKGIASEVAMMAMDYGFNTLKLDAIYAGAHIDNIGSNKILLKIGLKYIETFEYDNLPHYWYGIQRDEWINS